MRDRTILVGYTVMSIVTIAGFMAVISPRESQRLVFAGVALVLGWGLYLMMSQTRMRITAKAITDPLTGLYNRRHLLVALDQHMRQVDLYGGQLALILIDLDNFKTLNDTKGHHEGDKALAGVAEILKRCIRRTDLAFRYGGDEMLLLLPIQRQSETDFIVARIMEGISRLGLQASLGQACYPQDAKTSAELFRLADQTLLAVKRQGKGRLAKAGENRV